MSPSQNARAAVSFRAILPQSYREKISRNTSTKVASTAHSIILRVLTPTIHQKQKFRPIHRVKIIILSYSMTLLLLGLLSGSTVWVVNTCRGCWLADTSKRVHRPDSIQKITEADQGCVLTISLSSVIFAVFQELYKLLHWISVNSQDKQKLFHTWSWKESYQHAACLIYCTLPGNCSLLLS